MAKILVTYELKAPGRDYQPVHDYLQGFVGWVKPHPAVYLIKTDVSVADIRDRLKRLVHQDDPVFVVDITSSTWATYNLPKTSEWLNSR
jgi:hypothetical protein